MSNELVRRQFLKAGIGFIAGVGSTKLFSDFSTVVLAQDYPSFPPPVPSPPEQADWRYCNKCQVMFYQGAQGSEYDQRRGVCPKDGAGHEPAGYNFVLPWSRPLILR